jgi:hypothetical protein
VSSKAREITLKVSVRLRTVVQTEHRTTETCSPRNTAVGSPLGGGGGGGDGTSGGEVVVLRGLFWRPTTSRALLALPVPLRRAFQSALQLLLELAAPAPAQALGEASLVLGDSLEASLVLGDSRCRLLPSTELKESASPMGVSGDVGADNAAFSPSPLTTLTPAPFTLSASRGCDGCSGGDGGGGGGGGGKLLAYSPNSVSSRSR